MNTSEQKAHNFLYWEFPEYGAQVALRIGDWKVIRQHLKDDKAPTLELYNLSTDPAETKNVADKHPEVIAQAAEIFKKEHENATTERFRIPAIENGLLSN